MLHVRARNAGHVFACAAYLQHPACLADSAPQQHLSLLSLNAPQHVMGKNGPERQPAFMAYWLPAYHSPSIMYSLFFKNTINLLPESVGCSDLLSVAFCTRYGLALLVFWVL